MGTKLFLKGDKCSSPKCAMIKKPYPPGEKRKKKGGGLSEYGKELQEKQKLKNWYNLKEEQFSRYVREVLKKRGRVENAGSLLIKKLEGRFDNVIFRLGFASSREQARQLVNHGHFLINAKKNDIPSCQVKKGDKITLKTGSLKKNFFKNLSVVLKKHKPPAWLKLNLEKMEGEVVSEPFLEEGAWPAELSIIFEYYSR